MLEEFRIKPQENQAASLEGECSWLIGDACKTNIQDIFLPQPLRPHEWHPPLDLPKAMGSAV